MIYFIEASDRVKIGYSNNPAKRIKSFQTECPYEIEVLLIIEGDRDKERELHFKFSKSRRTGEWFQFEKDMKSYIDLNIYQDRKYEFGFCYDDFASNDQVARLRKQEHIGTKTLSDRLNICQQAVSAFERRERIGSIAIRNMKKIGDALGYRFEYRFVKKDKFKEIELKAEKEKNIWEIQSKIKI